MENLAQNELSKKLSVIWHPHPVTPIAGRETLVATAQEGLSVREVLINSGIDPHQPIVIWLDDRMLTVEEWDSICPREGQLLNVQATVMGGDNIFRTIALIAVVVVAAAVTGGAAAGVFGASFAAGTVGASIAGAVIGIGGSLLVNAIFSPKAPDVSVNGQYEKASPTYSLAGGSNNSRPYESMPVIMGNHQFFPDFGSKPFTQYLGADQYLYQIFHLGLSTADTSNWKIGTNPITNYTDYEFHNTDVNGKMTDFPGNVDTSAGAALTYAAGTIVRTTSTHTYQVAIDIEGVLLYQNDEGGLDERTVQVKVEYRPTGSGSYSAAPIVAYGDGFASLGGGVFSVTGNSQKPRRGTIYFDVTDGEYDVAVTRLTPDSTDSRESTTTNFTVLRSYQLDQANYIGQKRIGLTIKASEQLNGTVNKLSVYAEAYATYYDGADWVTAKTSNPAHWFMHFAKGQYASNGKLLFGIGLSDSQLDLDGLAQWADFCDTELLTFNAVLDNNQTCANILDAISKCGFGSPSWASGKLGVVYDARDAAPTMTFGMSNIIRDSFDVAYITEQLADEIVVRFRDPNKEWEQNEVRVLVPDVTNPLRSSSVDLFGCTDQDMAGKYANYIAAQQYYRRRRISWDTDFEGFVCQRGDVVLLSHDLTQWGYSGRIISSDGFESVQLDRSVPRNGQIEHLMLIRPDGSTSTYEIVTGTEGTESDTLTLANDFISLQEGYEFIDHRWCFSPLATPGKKVKIVSVQPVSESRLKITATDEYPEFYDAWGGTFIAPTNPSVLPAQPITVTNLTVVARSAIVNGYKSNRVTAYWNVGGGTSFCRVRVFFDGTLIAENAEVLTNDFEIDVYSGGLFRIEVTPFGITGAGITEVAQLTVDSLDLPAPPTSIVLSGEDGKSATYTWTSVIGVQSYIVEVWSGGVQRRSVNVGNTLSWTYTVDDAIADGGTFRSYQVRVFSVSNSGQSATYASVNFSNPQIGALVNANIEPMPNSVWFRYDKPSESDFAAVMVWMSTTSGFTPSAENLVYEGAENWVVINADNLGNPLESAQVYHFKAAGYDTFGKDSLTYTAELSATILSPAWGLIQGDIDETVLSLGLNERIDLIDTSGDPDMAGGLIQKVRSQATDLNILDTDISTIGQKLLEAELKVQTNTDLLYDAGLTIDSSTGEVYIYGVKQNANSIAAAEVRLDGAEANINLKASYNYVDEQVALAVIDPSQIAELGALTARVSTAEVDIDGLQAEIVLKADNTVVGTLGARVTSAEADIDGLQSEITLKASTTTVTALDNRVTTTETTLAALDVAEITSVVSDIRFLNDITDQQAETTLRDILTGQANYDKNVVGIAYAKEDLRAYTDGALLAEASSRLELAAILSDTQAALVNEQSVRATADTAEATARLELDARVTNAETGLTAAQAAITNEQTTRATADTALASSITTLTSTVNTNNATQTAAIQSEATTRANNDTALASTLTTVQTTVNGHTTSISTNTESINGIQGKYSVKVDNNGYVSGFGLISEANNGAPFSEFTIVADRFSLAPVATNPFAVDGSPFFVLTAPTTIDGVAISAGTYMKKAFIHDASITTAKIEEAAITNAKIANIDAGKINTGYLSADRIVAGSLDAKIANINAAVIIDGTITNAKIATLDAGKINTGTLSADRISTGSLDAKIASISGAVIQDATISNAKINALDAGKINTGTLSADRIAVGSLDAKIANINAAVIIDATITNAKIGNLQVSTGKISDNAVTNAGSINFGGTGYFYSDSYCILTVVAYNPGRSYGGGSNNPRLMLVVDGNVVAEYSGATINIQTESGFTPMYLSETGAAAIGLSAGSHSVGFYMTDPYDGVPQILWQVLKK